MSNLRKAAQQALEALEHHGGHLPWIAFVEVRKALRAALTEPVQEPVAWIAPDGSLRKTPGAKSFIDPTWVRWSYVGQQHGWITAKQYKDKL